MIVDKKQKITSVDYADQGNHITCIIRLGNGFEGSGRVHKNYHSEVTEGELRSKAYEYAIDFIEMHGYDLEVESEDEDDEDEDDDDDEEEPKEPEITTEEVTETVDVVSYSTVRNDTEDLPKGEEEVAQEGEDGYTEVTYLVTYEDGIEVSKEEKSRKTFDPVDEIINVGTFVEPVITTKEVTETIDIVNFDTVRNDTEELPKGEEEVVQEGKDGYTEVTYLVTYTDGAETSRDETDRKVVDPVDKIINVGTFEEPEPEPEPEED